MTHYRAAVAADAASLAPRLRLADLQEIQAAVGGDPAAALASSINISTICYAYVPNGTVEALFGAVEISPSTAVIWMVGTDYLTRRPRIMLVEGRRWFQDLHHRWSTLTNCVDARNTLHLRWLSKLGCEFTTRHESWGVAGLPFIEFKHHV